MASKFTTEYFIERSQKIHGPDKYDYSKVVYVNSKRKVEIICPKHGSFFKRPSQHLQGKGCAECSSRKKTNKIFIEEARSIHGDFYDYSEFEYKSYIGKSIVICPKHGPFLTSYDIHVKKKCGCPECGKEKASQALSMSFAIFKKRAQERHGGDYNFDKSIWVNATTEIEIKCNSCKNYFLRIPYLHLKCKGAGCPKCSGREKTTEIFIKQAKGVHGDDTYDYSRTKYIDSRTKVEVVCKKHGSFFVRPGVHLRGSKCIKCFHDSQLWDTDKFKVEAMKVHGNKYDYSVSNYKNYHGPIDIICKKHGLFTQVVSYHLSGKNGCPRCAGRVYSNDEFIAKAEAVHPGKYTYQKTIYKHPHEKIIVTCPDHGDFKTKPNTLLSGHGCRKCSNILVGKMNMMSYAEFYRRVKERYGDIYEIIEPESFHLQEKVRAICPRHGEFLKTGVSFLHQGGCPFCIKSKGELKIRSFLERKEIIFQHDHRFDSCRNKKPLPFDFYLPEYKILIEHDGVQHFSTVNNNFFGGEKALKERQHRDQIKTDWAAENGYKLIRIRYDQFDQIENILNRELLGIEPQFIPHQLALF